MALHHVNLTSGGLGSKQEFRRQVEGILHISCGVILRGIQCGKVIIIGLDLGSFIYAEAHGCEDIDQLITHLGYGMQVTGRAALCRHGDIDLLTLVAQLHLFFF